MFPATILKINFVIIHNGSVNQICEEFSVVKVLGNCIMILRVVTNFFLSDIFRFWFPAAVKLRIRAL